MILIKGKRFCLYDDDNVNMVNDDVNDHDNNVNDHDDNVNDNVNDNVMMSINHTIMYNNYVNFR